MEGVHSSHCARNVRDAVLNCDAPQCRLEQLPRLCTWGIIKLKISCISIWHRPNVVPWDTASHCKKADIIWLVNGTDGIQKYILCMIFSSINRMDVKFIIFVRNTEYESSTKLYFCLGKYQLCPLTLSSEQWTVSEFMVKWQRMWIVWQEYFEISLFKNITC